MFPPPCVDLLPENWFPEKLPGLSFTNNCNRFGVAFHFVNEFGSGKKRKKIEK